MKELMHTCAAQVIEEMPEGGLGVEGYQLSVAMGALRLASKGDSQGLLRLLRRSSSLRLALRGKSGWDLVRAASEAVETRYYAHLEAQLVGAAGAAGTHVEKRQRAKCGSRLMSIMRAWRRRRAPIKLGRWSRPTAWSTQALRARRAPCHAAPLVGDFRWGGSVESWRILRPRPGAALGGWRLEGSSRSFRAGGHDAEVHQERAQRNVGALRGREQLPAGGHGQAQHDAARGTGDRRAGEQRGQAHRGAGAPRGDGELQAGVHPGQAQHDAAHEGRQQHHEQHGRSAPRGDERQAGGHPGQAQHDTERGGEQQCHEQDVRKDNGERRAGEHRGRARRDEPRQKDGDDP